MVDSLKIHNISLEDTSDKQNLDDLSLSKKNGENLHIFLVETFYISSKKNTVFKVSLTNQGLILSKECNGTTKEQNISLEDIIGCRCLRSKRKKTTGNCACSSLPGAEPLKVVDENSGEQDETDVSAYLYIYAYVLKKGRRGCNKRERTSITLRFRSYDQYEYNNKEAQKWRTKIKALLVDEIFANPGTPHDPRKMLVILNPKSGKGKAREIFQQRVAPIFLEAELSYELHVTKRANFAREFVRTKNIYQWRGIVVVGGDGIYFEVVNGLFERPDWVKAFEEMAIGIIPCGSGNGLARSIAYIYNEPYEPKPVLGAALSIIRGHAADMDLLRVETRSEIMYSFLSVGWGLISDIDIESERLRAIGVQRFTIWSVHRLISLRTYKGIVSYLPAENIEINQENYVKEKLNGTKLKHSQSYNTTLDCVNCNGEGDCENCDNEFDDVLSLETVSGPSPFRPRNDSWYSATSRKSTYFSTADSIYQSVHDKTSRNGDVNGENKPNSQMYGPPSNIPALTAPVPDTWTKLTGDFIMVHAACQTHIGSDCFFAPSSKLSDNLIWLLIIRGGVSRSQLLSFLLGLSTGTHLPNPSNEFIQMIPCTAFRIEPGSAQQGFMTVDGEKVEYGPIQGEVFPSIAQVIVPS